MKRLHVFIAILVFAFPSYAQIIVGINEAKNAATRFAIRENLIGAQTNPRTDDSSVFQVVEGEDTLLYLIPVEDYTIIVSRLKCFPPILGYFKMPSQSEARTRLVNDNYFIQKYCHYSMSALARRVNTVSPQWETLYQETSQTPRTLFIDTLLTTKWGQDFSNDAIGNIDYNAYNYYVTEQCSCNTGDISPVGCVAVAMGQIMNYWQYPIIQYRKSHEHQFDWCNMADVLSTTSVNYTKERNAVARLLADCGTACDMSYCYMGGCWSFAWPADARDALVDTFGYSSDADLKRRFWYSDADWKQMLVDDLSNGFPVLYSSLSLPIDGHAFVCDGYNEGANLFHFNLGWHGTSNGWYNIDNLVFALVQDTDDYNHFERAIFHLHPPMNAGRDICDYPLSLLNYYYLYYILGENDVPLAYKNIPSTATVLYSVPVDQSIPEGWYTIPSGASAEYVAHKEVVLLPNFTVERGADFVVRIEPCARCEDRFVQGQAPQDDSPRGITGDVSDVRVEQGPSQTFTMPSQIQLFPNPTSEDVTIAVDGEVESVVVFNTMGMPMGGWRIRALSVQQVTLDMSSMSSGMYIVVVKKTDGQVVYGRIVKN